MQQAHLGAKRACTNVFKEDAPQTFRPSTLTDAHRLGYSVCYIQYSTTVAQSLRDIHCTRLGLKPHKDPVQLPLRE